MARARLLPLAARNRASMLGAAGRVLASQESGSDSNGYASANAIDAEIVPATCLPKAGSRRSAGLTPVLVGTRADFEQLKCGPDDLRALSRALDCTDAPPHVRIDTESTGSR